MAANSWGDGMNRLRLLCRLTAILALILFGRQELLAQEGAAVSAETRRLQTPEQIRAWLDSLAQFSDKIPPLPETISREWIYQDHD